MARIEAITSGTGTLAPKHAVFFIHGYGADANDLMPLSEPFSKALPPDTRYLSLQAPFECEAGIGRQWFSMSGGTNKELIRKGLDNARPLVLDFLAKTLAKLGNIPYGLVGFSQGAMLAIDTGLQADLPAPLKPPSAIVSYSGAFIGLPHKPTATPPVLAVHGDADEVIPPELLPITVQALEQAGIKVEHHLYPNLPHSISDEGLQDGARFLQENLVTPNAVTPTQSI